MTDKPPLGFVALTSVKNGPPDSAAALAQIREIYFKTTKRTIEHDLAHAIALLKSLPDEESREKATVYMHGLAEMRKEWKGPEREGPEGRERREEKSRPGKRERAKSGANKAAGGKRRRP